MNVPDDWERDLTLYQERVYTGYELVEGLMTDEPKIVYNGIAIYVTEAVKPDELWGGERQLERHFADGAPADSWRRLQRPEVIE